MRLQETTLFGVVTLRNAAECGACLAALFGAGIWILVTRVTILVPGRDTVFRAANRIPGLGVPASRITSTSPFQASAWFVPDQLRGLLCGEDTVAVIIAALRKGSAVKSNLVNGVGGAPESKGHEEK